MRVIGQDVLDRFKRKHADTAAWLNTWITTVVSADWMNIEDVRQSYPHADGVRLRSGNVVTVFNCKGNHYRLLTFAVYPIQTMQVLDVMTHSEYSKNLWKARY